MSANVKFPVHVKYPKAGMKVTMKVTMEGEMPKCGKGGGVCVYLCVGGVGVCGEVCWVNKTG